MIGEELALPPPEGSSRSWALSVKAKEQREVGSLRGSALRTAILEGMGVRKTAHPLVREIWWAGAKVGEVVKSPYQPFLWISSADQRVPFGSLSDAGVFVVARHLGAEL